MKKKLVLIKWLDSKKKCIICKKRVRWWQKHGWHKGKWRIIELTDPVHLKCFWEELKKKGAIALDPWHCQTERYYKEGR